MKIIPVEAGPISTNAYLIIDEASQKALVIDAPMESTAIIIAELEKYNSRLIYILLTHSHWDHTADAYDLKCATGAEIRIHKADEYRLIEPNAHTIWQIPMELKACKADKYLEEGDIISLGGIRLEILHTPGHTEGSICLEEKVLGLIFSGDTIFREGIGRTDLPGGSPEIIMDSILRKIMTLPDSYRLLCGHGEQTSVGYERNNNPFLMKNELRSS